MLAVDHTFWITACVLFFAAALLLIPKARLGLQGEGGPWPRTELVVQGFDKESLAPGAGLKVGDRIVALKFILPGRLTSPEAVRRLAERARIPLEYESARGESQSGSAGPASGC